MEENFILSVCGKQLVNGSSDKIELETSASYVQRGSSRYISYREYDSRDPSVHYRTTVKIYENGVVTVMKGGEENHNLTLEKGKRHKCEYNTPYGSITLGIYTESVRIDLDDHGGELQVSYNIDIGSELASKNELTLIIKEAKSHVNGSENDQQS